MATASPCLSRKSVMASSLWADQWPKSSGRASSDSNGSPFWVMCRRWASAEAAIIGKLAEGSRLRIAPAVRQSSSNIAGSLRRETFTASENPPMKSRSGRLSSRLGVVDDRPGDGERAQPVLLAEQVDAVLDPDARVGLAEGGGRQADQADASVGDRRREADGVEHRPAADHHDVAPPVEPRGVEDLEHPLQDVDVVLDRLATGGDLDVARPLDPVGMSLGEVAEPPLQVGPGAGDVLVDPELDLGRPVARRLEDLAPGCPGRPRARPW